MTRVMVVSDGTGRTAERIVRAALVQFEGVDVAIERRSDVRTEDLVRQVVAEAAQARAFVVYTLVSDELRDEMFCQARLHNVEAVDVLGPLLARLSLYLSVSPAERPGLFSELNEEYFRRVETMEFAFHHDDGQRAHELSKAEIVLVGVSRTIKTPVSIYLAFRGWLVANVPIVWGMEPPVELFRLPPRRVFGLTMDPVRLSELRRMRDRLLTGTTGTYADLVAVRREAKYALQIFRTQGGWSVVDVTDKPIEEIASEILTLVRHV